MRPYADRVNDRAPADPNAAPAEKRLDDMSFAELFAHGLGILKSMGPAGALAVFWAAFPPIGSIVLFTHINTIGQWLRDHHDRGLAIYIAGFVVLAGCGLLPTYASAILGGWAFGFAEGFPAAMAGFVGASVVGRILAGSIGKGRVEKLIHQKPKWQAVRDALIGGSPLKTLAIVTMLRLPPNSPFAVTNFVLTTTRVPLWIYMIGTAVGMAPRTAVVVYIASTLQDKVASEAAQTKPWWIIAAGIVLSLIVLGILALIANKALAALTKTQPAATATPAENAPRGT